VDPCAPAAPEALELARLEEQVRTLTMALSTNRVISTAIGLMMERQGLDRAAAHAQLVRLSQHTNTKVAALAEQIVRAAEDRTSV
jgi:AmiR/NasT family two-component response regulator